MNMNSKISEMQGHKTLVIGLQGSGKTYWAKQKLKTIEKNKKILIYSPHKWDWRNMPDNFIFLKYENFGDPKEVEKVMGIARDLAKKGELYFLVIDEFDMLFSSNLNLGRNSVDVFANHRHFGEQINHKGLGIFGITRRPQDIPTRYVESCRYLVVFSIEGENVKKKLNAIFKGFGDKVARLNYTEYKYYVKEIGKSPTLFNPLGAPENEN